MSKDSLRNTTTQETEVLGSHIERQDGTLYMVTDVRTTTRTYDGRGFAGARECYQTLRLPLAQVEKLHESQVGTMAYYLTGSAAEDGDDLSEREPHLSIRHAHDPDVVIERFRSVNQAREYKGWADRLGLVTKGWGVYRDEDTEHPMFPVDYLNLEQTR